MTLSEFNSLGLSEKLEALFRKVYDPASLVTSTVTDTVSTEDEVESEPKKKKTRKKK